MQKYPSRLVLILAGALLPAFSAFAQSAVTLYGWTDIGYVKETGKDWRMDENDSNALGIKGTEDLGGGLKATFDLQTRFTLQNGQLESSEGAEWEGAANMGLAGNWGSLRLGRLNEVATETFRVLDPFNQDGPASMLRSSQRLVRVSRTLRYDSPAWHGLYLRAAYSLVQDSRHAEPGSAAFAGKDHSGYAASLRYDRGPFFLLGSWSRKADSGNASLWNLGGAYTYGPLRFSIGYEYTKDNGWKNGEYSNASLAEAYGATGGIRSRQQSWVAGIKWTASPGIIDLLFNHVRLKNPRMDGAPQQPGPGKATKYAIGYTYNLSNNTQLYTKASFTDFDTPFTAAFYRGKELDDQQAFTFQLGLFHRF